MCEASYNKKRTSNMFQGWEVDGCQHKYKEESAVMETTLKVNGQCTGGHGEENFISNDVTSIQNGIQWRRLVAASSSF